MTTAAPVILIVDDDLPTLLLLRRLILSIASHSEIIAVNSGASALAVMDERPVTLVITDYYMPGMNGVQLTGMIKAASPAVHVAIMTVYDVNDVAAEMQAVAADYVLPKPFVLSQLKQVIDECVPLAERDRFG
jgi:DNA-binding NtrC family response regulator